MDKADKKTSPSPPEPKPRVMSDLRMTRMIEHEADKATAISMLFSIIFTIVAFRLNFGWLNSLYMVLIGMGSYILSNLIALVLLRPVRDRKIWALLVMELFYHLLPFSVALYFAGIFVLITKAVIAAFSFIWALF